MSLFRPEVVEAQRKRLHGSVTIHQSPSLMVMTGVAVGVTLLAGTFLVTGSISRKESVVGWVAPDAGLAEIYAPKGGVVQRVAVKLGDVVKDNQPLALLSEDVSTGQGDLAPQQRVLTKQRIAELDGQIESHELSERQEAARLIEQGQSLREEAAHLQAEKGLLEQQLILAKREVLDIQSLIAKGFVTTVEKDRREQVVFSTEQALADIERQIGAKRAAASDADAQARALPAATAQENSQLRAQREALEQSLAELAAQDTLLLKAPFPGTVAAVNIHPGDTALPNGPLFAIAPNTGRLVAEILAPTKAAGFIAKGQRVRLMVDAFPSERFGAVEAVVDTVSRAPIMPAQVGIPLDIKEPVYRITATLATDHVNAYGRPRALMPGMTFKASVVTAKRTFLQWMLDPLFAAGRDIN